MPTNTKYKIQSISISSSKCKINTRTLVGTTPALDGCKHGRSWSRQSYVSLGSLSSALHKL